MAMINLELWQKPNFPPLEILESRTKTVLENFNRCRKLDIKLQTNDNKIEKFYPLFNSLTERRAVESLRLSMYAEDVELYMKLLSEENTSVGVILETLSSLLDEAKDRQEITKKLKEDYQDFLKNFNSEFANVRINVTSNSRQIIIRNQKPSTKRVLVIEIMNIVIPILFGYGVFKFSQKSLINKRNFLNQLLVYTMDRNNDVMIMKNNNKVQNDGNSNNGFIGENESSENNENNIEDDGGYNEYVPSENPFSQLPEIDRKKSDSLYSGFNKVLEKNNEKLEDSVASLFSGFDKDLEENNEKLEDSITPKPDIDSSVTGGTAVGSIVAGGTLSLPPSDHKNTTISQYLAAGFFGIVLGYFMWKLLRKTKPTQYRWWMKFFLNENNDESQRLLDGQQQSIEKDNRILEIKEKLPVIYQNIEILDQFWDNQVVNIKSHIETLKSVNENEKIKIPKQLAAPIKEDWNKQYIESKANYIRMKSLVTHNSLLTIDVSKKNIRLSA